MFDDFVRKDQLKILRTSFERVKKDIFTLGKEFSELKKELLDIKDIARHLDEAISELKMRQIRQISNSPPNVSTHPSTHKYRTSTHPATSTHPSTHLYRVRALKYPNLKSSIGNRGASTDRQTDRQTDSSTHFIHKMPSKTPKLPKSVDQSISKASEILGDLDSLKKQIRLKFKQMTEQEMLVFSTIYQLEEQNLTPDYQILAQKLNLSQSSIRDYVQRMINKGIPIHKTKLNNKKIILSISSELKKIAPLDTIIRLREL